MRREEFLQFARSGTVVPVYRELAADTLTPVTAFLRLRRSAEPAFLLESVEGGARLGRYSFIGRDPFRSLAATGDELTLTGDGESVTRRGDFFRTLAEEVGRYRVVEVPGLPPLTAGAVGYMSYDAVRYIEKLPDRHASLAGVPDAQFHFYNTLIAFDHARHRLVLIAGVLVDDERDRDGLVAKYERAVGRLDALESELRTPNSEDEVALTLEPLEREMICDGMQSNFTKEEFEAAVVKAKEYIAAGDAFQIVLSQRFERVVDADSFEVYRALRTLNPSPYLFYLQWDESAVIGSSPETMVRVENRRTMVRPIAGTRRRGVTELEDKELEDDLLGDEKELAEHRMLVDLGRNDVGRVAQFGTVEVPRLEEVERYSHVMHIVSQVEGVVRDELTSIDAFCAGFPAGTVSGAPKIRAMEIIDELERSRRGVYAGAVGYVDFAGNLDTAIAIRTLFIHKGVAMAQAGAGIVADSVPENEYFETVHKAGALYDAIRLAEKRAAKAGRESDA